ncbi:hypothetical protein AAGV28_14100 [Flavobacterium sp. FZUC8N2.13]|uniref:Uncharacterized protein n=1 Tax=Flavobacterium zubiriense TaxID=3138075 RepID=A0ABV4TGP6_9FLAO
MKIIEFYLNIVHFCYYKAHYKLHLLTNKVNPFRLLAEIPVVKKRLEKKGVKNIQKEIDTAFGNKKNGLSITVAGGFLFVLLFFFFFGVFSLIYKSFTAEYLKTSHFVVFGVLSTVVCYAFVFKKDKYIKYFDKFEKWNKGEKRKYNFSALCITVIIIAIWILSF